MVPCLIHYFVKKGTDLFDEKGTFIPDEDIAVSILSEFAKMADKQIGVMPDRGSIFDPVFFSGDLEMGEVLCVIGADWYGLDLFQQFAPGMEGMWGMLPLPHGENRMDHLVHEQPHLPDRV